MNWVVEQILNILETEKKLVKRLDVEELYEQPQFYIDTIKELLVLEQEEIIKNKVI